MLGLVTLNWNQAGLTSDCIQSLQEQAPKGSYFCVVDNGSSAEDIQLLESLLQNVDIIKAGKNLGFAAGFNLGVKAALEKGCDPILMINNDTIAEAGMLEALMHAISGEEIGVVSPLIYYFDNPDQVWSSGGKLDKTLLISLDPHNRSQKISQDTIRTSLTGCCLMFRAVVWKQLGGFDERFFMYFEDKDYFARLLTTKWKAKVIPSAKLLHKVSLSSGGEYSLPAVYLSAKSSILYYAKHLSIVRAIPFFLFRLAAFVYNSVKYLIKGGPQVLKAYVSGIGDGLKLIKSRNDV